MLKRWLKLRQIHGKMWINIDTNIYIYIYIYL